MGVRAARAFNGGETHGWKKGLPATLGSPARPGYSKNVGDSEAAAAA